MKKPWTIGAAKAQAMLFERKVDWVYAKKSAYHWARKNGHLPECTVHAPVRVASRERFWTLERCKEDAAKYETRTKWQYGAGGGYQAARVKGWVEACCQHMPPSHKKRNRWTNEELIADGRKYRTKHDWRRHSTAYQTARMRGILPECTKHMVRGRSYAVTLTLNRCMYEALDFRTIDEWKLGDYESYKVAVENGWVEKCTEHMC